MRRLYCRRILAVTALLLLPAVCAAEGGGSVSDTKHPEKSIVSPVPGTAEDKREYSIHPDGGGTITFNADGTIIDQQERFDTIYDLLTGEPMLLTRRRVKAEEERNENGYPVTHEMTALYDLEGKLLHDWAEYSYRDGFGDYVIRMDNSLYYNMGWKDPERDEYLALWNYKTEEDAVPEVWRIEKLNEHSMLVSDVDEMLMGIVELGDGGAVFRPAPEGYQSAYEWYGYILADPVKGSKSTLMNSDYTPIFLREHMSGEFYGRLRGKYITYSDSSAHDAVLNEKGEHLFSVPAGEDDLEYFDGELALVKNYDEKNSAYSMLKADGTLLAGGYHTLLPSDENNAAEQPAPYFIGAKGNTVDILDRSGRVTATKEIPGLASISIFRDGWCSYTLVPEGDKRDKYGDITRGFVGILDNELNTVVQANKYTYIETGTNWNNREMEFVDLIRGRKTASGRVDRWDIFDLSGKVLVENLTQVGDAGPNRIAAVKGFNVGLMDGQGNWITKQSIFDKLEDETEDPF